MNVKQLKDELSKYPESMDVFLAERTSDFAYGLLNSVRSKEIPFSENLGCEDAEEKPRETVIILNEE